MAGWVRGLPVVDVVFDALPRPAADDPRHPLRAVADLTPADIALAVKGAAEGLERVLTVRPSRSPAT